MEEPITENKTTSTPRRQRGPHYTTSERRKIVEELRGGVSREALGERYRLSCSTLKRWQQEAPRFAKVRIQQEAPASKKPESAIEKRGVLRSPRGFVIDGLSVGDLAELLSRLG